MANLVLGLYLTWRFIWPLPIEKWKRVTLSLISAALLEHHWLVSKLVGTSIPSPELPRFVLLLLGVCYATLLLLAIGVFIKDCLAIAVYALSKRVTAVLLHDKRIGGGLVVVCLVLAMYGAWAATKVPEVQEVDISVQGLPSELEGYRLVLLTDLHASRLLQGSWMRAVVEKTNRLQPSLIAISGDLVDGTTADRADDVAPLRELNAPDGVFAVSGNHEYYAEYAAWMNAFKSLGIDVLDNRHVVIRAQSGGFVLAGVPDQVAQDRGQPGPDIKVSLAGKPTGLPVILLDHRPGSMHFNQAQGVDLQLSGHTHGGHIRGIDMIVRQFNGGFVSGLYDVDGSSLYVSNGAGLWPGFPTRIGRPSEITLIKLISR